MSIPYHIKDKINWYLWKSMINEINDEYKRKIIYVDDYYKGLKYLMNDVSINFRRLDHHNMCDFLISNFTTGFFLKNYKDTFIRTPPNYIYSSGRLSKSGYLYKAKCYIR